MPKTIILTVVNNDNRFRIQLTEKYNGFYDHLEFFARAIDYPVPGVSGITQRQAIVQALKVLYNHIYVQPSW